MKFLCLGLLMACELVYADERLHILVAGDAGAAQLAALSIERGVTYPSVVQLKGDVEIRAKGMIVRADQAEFNEQTGEIDAHGNIHVAPYPASPEAQASVSSKPRTPVTAPKL